MKTTKIIERNKVTAKKHCSNYDRDGNCIGAFFLFNKDKQSLDTTIDKAFAGKPCVVEKGCDFFERIVVKGIAVG